MKMNKRANHSFSTTKLTVTDDSITLKNGQLWKNLNFSII